MGFACGCFTGIGLVILFAFALMVRSCANSSNDAGAGFADRKPDLDPPEQERDWTPRQRLPDQTFNSGNIEIVSTYLIDVRTATGQDRKMLQVNWKNVGAAPVFGVAANITALDEDGQPMTYKVEDYYLFVTDKVPVYYGQTYHEPRGEGHTLLPLYGEPASARVEITRALTAPVLQQ